MKEKDKRKAQREMWHKINEPIVEETRFLFKNGKPWLVLQTVDKVPPIRRERRKHK